MQEKEQIYEKLKQDYKQLERELEAKHKIHINNKQELSTKIEETNQSIIQLKQRKKGVSSDENEKEKGISHESMLQKIDSKVKQVYREVFGSSHDISTKDTLEILYVSIFKMISSYQLLGFGTLNS